MNKKIAWSVMVFAGLALGACGTVDGDEPSVTTTPAMDTNDDDPAMTGTDGPVATDGPNPGESGQMEETGDGATDDGPMDGGFIQDPDGGGVSFECDIFAQDCPDGEKCMPWAADGGSSWNATRCSPISENPGQPGDECTVEGSGTSGIDNCDIGGMCWDVDPETNVGTCVAMCTGDESNPICEDPDTTCTIANDGAIVLCLPSCDPLLQDCADGQACYPINEAFACAPDASGEMGASGDPCEFINVCDAGNFCLDASAWPGCAGSIGCCSPVCDLSDPAGDGQCPGMGQTCQAWYEEGAAPPGYEDVGACALPA
ncbi:MAG: ribulose phosphate epimerase [Nannocystaceae bacterium]